MEIILADITVSLSEFKKDPISFLHKAQNRPVAVLNYNKPAFYVIEPCMFEAMLEKLADQYLQRTIFARLAEKSDAIAVEIDNI